MIEAGDGKMAALEALGLCPRCQSGLLHKRDRGHKVESVCGVCGIKIIEVKEQPREEG